MMPDFLLQNVTVNSPDATRMAAVGQTMCLGARYSGASPHIR